MLPELESNTGTSEASLIDVDGSQVETVQPEFFGQEIKTNTQAAQHDREALESSSSSRTSNRTKSSSSLSKSRPGAENPLLIGNAVVVAALAGVFGWNGWRWWRDGAKGGAGVVAGAVAAVGIFGVGDYYLTRWATSR